MSRDHKLRNSPTGNRNRGGTLIGIFVGLVLGVVIAAGVVWYMNKMPNPFQAREKQSGKNGEGHKPDGTAESPGAPAPLPGKPGDKTSEKAGEKPRFEFYKILPGAEEAAPQPAPKSERKTEPSGGDTLYLQAGAFQNPADADNLKAQLALMGVEASVQQVNVPEKGIMHRVRIGPYRAPDEMSKVRTLLAQNGIQATVVRVKEGAN